MERFDEVVTDRAVRLADVERYLERSSATDRFRGRYRVAATGGTTGLRAAANASRCGRGPKLPCRQSGRGPKWRAGSGLGV